ncbi:hypothetical protein [Actinoplanes sp. NPDC051411]|uniref:hypothetical protein n=1 Tax=Actinoplanes sp. NPDC051411 TaxID=3155522 RepID=UPI00342935DB
MAFRTWAKLFGATLGAGAAGGASQLGLAYGLGVLRLTRVVDVTARDQWMAQLAWVAWIAMTSAVIGAMAGRGALPRQAGAFTRLVASVSSALGAAVVVPLTMEPARTAQIAGVRPVFIIGVCATLGAAVGILAAYATISRAVARWNLTAMSAVVWAIAIVSVIPSLAPSKPLPAIRLGVIDASFLSDSVTRRTALFTMPVLALICGIAVGVAARRRVMSTLTVALSGLAGPALLTLSYLVAGPGSGDDHYQVVPYWAAMTAAGAGVLGSVLVAVLSRGPAASADGRDPGKGSPTPDRPPLPRREAQPSSAIAQAAAAAAQRSEEQLKPSDTGIFTVPSDDSGPRFNGFAPRPQPQAMNAPPTAPAPVSPPLSTNPAPRPRGRNGQGDEFVDWVSGLGNG